MVDTKGRFVAVMLCLFLASMTCRHVQAEITLEEGPHDVTAIQGETVTFVCDFRNVDGYDIYWRYGDNKKYLTVNRALDTCVSMSLKNRLSVIGDVSKEEFVLRIENVQEADSGVYYCAYIGDCDTDNQVATNIGSAVLTVLILPSPQSPTCWVELPGSSGTNDVFAVGDEVYLRCNANGGNPRPDLTYSKEDKTLAGPATSITHLYQLTAEDNGVTFTCTMMTPALNESRSCSVMPLMILPTVTIKQVESMSEEGSNVTFVCYGEGVPSIANYRWTVRNVDTGETLASEKYTVSDNGSILYLKVLENTELHCIVSVPSGLSSNPSTRVAVMPHEETTPGVRLTTQASHTNAPSSSVVAGIVVAVVLVLVVIVVIFLFLWRRRQQRKSNIPIDPKIGYTLNEIGDEYDEIGGRNGEESNEATIEKDKTETTAGKAEKDKARNDSHPSEVALYAKPNKLAKDNGRSAGAAITDANHPAPPDPSPLYAQPDKKPKPLKENEYSSVAEDRPDEKADLGLLYADLDLNDQGTSTDNSSQPTVNSSSEQTVYAMIRT